MKNMLIGLLAGILLGVIGGFSAGIFFFPYLFPPAVVNEELVGRSEIDKVAQGTFIHANPSDLVHYGKGTVTIYGDVLRLEDDFAVGPGPKFHVYLVPEQTVTPETRIQDTMFVDLGRLKSFMGSQNYPLPEGIDLKSYPYVVIWCEQFNVLVSPARLAFRQ